MDRIGHRISFDFPGLRLDFWFFQTDVTLFVGESTAAKIFTKALVGICGYRLRAYSCASILQPGQVRHHSITLLASYFVDGKLPLSTIDFCPSHSFSIHGTVGSNAMNHLGSLFLLGFSNQSWELRTWQPWSPQCPHEVLVRFTSEWRNAERCAICDAKFSSSFAEHLCSRRHFSALFHAVSTMAPMLSQGVVWNVMEAQQELHQIYGGFLKWGIYPQSSCILDHFSLGFSDGFPMNFQAATNGHPSRWKPPFLRLRNPTTEAFFQILWLRKA